MATERELVGQSRNHVILPVVRIIFRSLLLPFTRVRQVWKISLATFGVMLGTNLTDLLVGRYTDLDNNLLFQILGVLVHAVVIVPFAVVWSKIAIDVTKGDEGFRALPLGSTELWYAVANVAMWLLFLVPMMLLFGLITTARQAGDEATMGVAAMFALTVLIVVAILVVRMSFLFPAIATGSYRGVRTAWRQTRGYLEALGSIEAGVCVPFLIVWLVARHFRSPEEGYLEWFAFYALGDAVLLLWEAGFVAGPALAYELLVLRQGPSD
jgi:hypothetical protein